VNELQTNAFDYSLVDEALEKVNRLHELLKEANSLADELASKEVNIKTSIKN